MGEKSEYLGSPVPTRTAALGSRLGLWRRVGVYARLEHQGGVRLLNQTRLLRCTIFENCREAYDPATPLEDQAAIAARSLGTNAGFIEEADFVRLREVALVLAVPAALARRMGAAGLDLSLVGHDLATWTGYTGLDPEVNTFGQAPFQRSDRYAQPHLRRWDLRLDVRR